MEDAITSVDLLGPLMKYSWDYFVISYAFTLLGIATHYVKKCVQEKLDFVRYWTANKQSSVLVILTATASYFTTLLVDPNPNLMTFLAISYMADSMLNKDGGPRNTGGQNGQDSDEPKF